MAKRRKKNRTYHPRREKVDGYAVRKHPSYQIWASMLSRCTDRSNPSYIDYGGRGIGVDPRWHHFRFFARDMGMRPRPDWTIERKDNEKGYCKDNCVWANRSDQCVNRRRFKNNMTGKVGVVKIDEHQWEARFEYDGKRYRLGRYVTRERAIGAREQFVKTFSVDKSAAIATLIGPQDTVWNNSKTRQRGVCPHADGKGFIARCTINGERHYVGYFLTLEEAMHARSQFIKTHTS